MRKIIGICAAASAAVLLTFAVAVAMVAVESNKLDLESHQYAESAIVAVVSKWDTSALTSRASEQLSMSAQGADELHSVFSGFRIMGRLKHYYGCYGRTSFLVAADGNALVMAEYSARAEFQNGPAEIHITLIREQDSWKILRFAVSPIVGVDQSRPSRNA
ncbi:MAG TPA: hypothetical protein VMV27_12280 [Candidatus Binataceae bacterium]|nr:hypothetical protein [Candidatus Binataceae bacterium]